MPNRLYKDAEVKKLKRKRYHETIAIQGLLGFFLVLHITRLFTLAAGCKELKSMGLDLKKSTESTFYIFSADTATVLKKIPPIWTDKALKVSLVITCDMLLI